MGRERYKEFTRLAENSKKAWKPISKDIEIFNLGTKQENKELKIGIVITTKEKDINFSPA